jgi:hypothetical protein
MIQVPSRKWILLNLTKINANKVRVTEFSAVASFPSKPSPSTIIDAQQVSRREEAYLYGDKLSTWFGHAR